MLWILSRCNFCLGQHTNSSKLFDKNDKFRALHVNNPLTIQTTNDAYLTIDADCYTKTEVDGSLALKQIKFQFGEIPATTASSLFDYNDYKSRAIHVKTHFLSKQLMMPL